MIIGLPLPFTSSRLLPATSPLTFANFFAYSRHSFAGAASKPEGPGVSRSCFKKLRDSVAIIRGRGVLGRVEYSTARRTLLTHPRERLLQDRRRRGATGNGKTNCEKSEKNQL